MHTVMPGMFPSLIFRFKVAMAANSKMGAILLRKIFLNIYIKQCLVNKSMKISAKVFIFFFRTTEPISNTLG